MAWKLLARWERLQVRLHLTAHWRSLMDLDGASLSVHGVRKMGK